METSANYIIFRKCEDSFTPQSSDINFHFWNRGKVSAHSHEYFEIFLMTEGKVEHKYNGTSSVLKQGTLCVIRPGDTHAFTPIENERSEHFNVRITKSLFYSLCSTVSPSLYENVINNTKPVKCKLKKFEMEYFSQLIHTPQFIFKSAEDESALSVLKVIVVNFLLSVHHSLKFVSNHPKWFQNFLDEINSPQVFSMPLSEIYKLSGYSQVRLNTYFKQYMGMTLISYMTKLKISYACNLLQTSNYNILQISLMASFNTLCHFNYVFKKTMGVTPTEYRHKFQKTTF